MHFSEFVRIKVQPFLIEFILKQSLSALLFIHEQFLSTSMFFSSAPEDFGIHVFLSIESIPGNVHSPFSASGQSVFFTTNLLESLDSFGNGWMTHTFSLTIKFQNPISFFAILVNRIKTKINKWKRTLRIVRNENVIRKHQSWRYFYSVRTSPIMFQVKYQYFLKYKINLAVMLKVSPY